MNKTRPKQLSFRAADAGANQGAANDDVVDGDYKEV